MINVVVEGESDREAAKAVVRTAGHEVGKVRIAGGTSRLDPKIRKYNQAARQSAWVIFRDSDSECPVALSRTLLADVGEVSSRFQLRIAHSMTEAWLLADQQGFADYFGVSAGKIPRDPESLPHAKKAVLQLCADSRLRAIRQDMVTSAGETGPLYVQRINEFASQTWDVESARSNSDSLQRAVERLKEML